jgi:phosphatidate cytidylyltransferase
VTDLVRRTITGVFIIIFVLGGVWLHPASFFIVGALLVAGTQYEYYRMVKRAGIRPQIVAGMITGFMIYLLSTLVASCYIPQESIFAIIPLLSLLMVIELFRKADKPVDSLVHTLFSIFYTVLPLSLLPFAAFDRTGISPVIEMNGIIFSPGIVIGFFLLLWTNDTSAYLVGSLLGKHHLMERISPKKTWEGFIGGMIMTILVAQLLSGWIGILQSWEWTIIAVIIAGAGTLGDLIESMIKRSLGLKDSGALLPGHGGLLDRFDSVMVAFPLVMLYITVFA